MQEPEEFKSQFQDESLGLEDEEWDVIIPSYEDSTGILNEGDVGGHGNFTG